LEELAMSRLPNKIGFICGECGCTYDIAEIRNCLPECHQCGAGNWTIVILYQDVSVETSGASILSGLTTGFSWRTSTTHSNEKRYENVSSQVVHFIVEDDSMIGIRIEGFARRHEQHTMIERGGRTCEVCEQLFVPSEDKSWTQKGFCSKSCAAKAGADLEEAGSDSISSFPTVKQATAVCENGHEFSVPVTYSGCLRPCPECKSKTPIP
jgi:hypothetical protein